MRLNKETLREVGELLFGPDWITPLARALVSDKTGRPIDLRTVQRWANGQFEVPDTPHLRGQLAALARARGEELAGLADALEPKPEGEPEMLGDHDWDDDEDYDPDFIMEPETP